MSRNKPRPLVLCSTPACMGDARIGGQCRQCYDNAKRRAKTAAKKLAASLAASPGEEQTGV